MGSGWILTLYYQRLREKGEEEYPYKGRIELVRGNDEEIEHFIGWTYKKIIARLHEVVKEREVDRVLLQRTERYDLHPVELGKRILELIKVDPLSAYRALSYSPVKSQDTHRVRACHDTLAEAFGETLYLKVDSGRVENPETGELCTLAYGEAYGWRINRGDNKPKGWIKIELIDEAPDDVSFGERIAFTKWAVLSTRSLLEQKFERYHLPRAWNTKGPWISHMELSSRLDRFLKEKEQAACH